MSRGLGRVQSAILDQLADPDYPDGLFTFDLIYKIYNAPQDRLYGGEYRAGPAVRRALAVMQRRGLVKCDSWYPHMQGRPKIWEITEAGREVQKSPRPSRSASSAASSASAARM